MTAFGSYETVQDIPSRPGMRVATARPAGADAPPGFVLKSPVSLIGVDSPADAERRRRALLASAAAQAQVAGDKRGRHWAAVSEISSAASETFVVLERFDRSVGDLARQRRLTRGELKSVVLAVLNGLAELAAVCGRGHGGVHARNVLLRGKGRDPVATVVLTDPAPTAPSPEQTDASDLGFLIRHLGAGFEARVGEPTEAAWGHLGSAAAIWRGLAQELVHAGDGGPTPLLSAVRDRVAKEAPGDPRGRKLPLLVAAVVVLVLAGAGWWVVASRPRGPTDAELAAWWPEICQQVGGWARELVPEMREIETPADLGPEGREFVSGRLLEIKNQWDALVAAVPTDGGQKLWSPLDYEYRLDQEPEGPHELWRPANPIRDPGTHVEAVHLAVRGLEAMLVGDGQVDWSTQTRLAEFARIFEQRGWAKVAVLIAEARDRLRPDDEAYWQGELPRRWGSVDKYRDGAAGDLAQAIVDAVVLEYEVGRLDAAWTRVQAEREELARLTGGDPGDPVLDAVGGLADRVIEPLTSAGDRRAISEVAHSLQALVGELVAARELVERDWTRLHAEEFRRQSAGLLPAGGLTTETLQQWRDTAQGCLIPDGADPVAVLLDELRKAGEDLTSFTAGQGTEDPAVAALRGELGRLETTLRGVGLVWIEKNRTTITEAEQRARPEFDRLRERVNDFETTPEELLAVLRTDTDAPDLPSPLKAYWDERRAAWVEGVETGTMVPYLVKRSREQLKGSLQAIGDSIAEATAPATPAGFDQLRIDTAFRDEHARTLRSVLDSVDAGWELGSYSLDDAGRRALTTAADSWTGWVDRATSEVSALVATYDQLRAYAPLVDGGDDGVTDGWAARPMYAELGGDDTFGPLADLAADLRAVRAADRDGLIGWIGSVSDKPQAAYAAWRRLGTPEVLWPATAEELAAAGAYLADADAVFRGVEALRARGDELGAEAARRWREAVLNIMSRQQWVDLESAFKPEVVQAFGVNPDETPEAIRINLALYGLRQAAAGDDAAAEAGVAAYRSAVAGLAHDSLAGLARTLSEFEAQAQGGTATEKLVGAGPGSPGVGWTGSVPEPPDGRRLGEVLVFSDGGLDLRFDLVDESNNRLAYLGTSEVSIAVASRAVSSGGGADDASVLQGLGANPWVGVRMWEAQGRRLTAPRDSQGRPSPEGWFKWSERANQAPQKFVPLQGAARLFGGAAPAEEYPLQNMTVAQATAIAAALGCRIPTLGEWEAAVAMVPSPGSNLRDASFLQQRDFVLGLNRPSGGDFQLPFPDEGIFGLTPDNSGLNAVGGAGTDSTLFFEPVGGEGGFENLIGNVAELVLDGSGRVAVVGGSALSPPEVDPRQARRVGIFGADDQLFADVGLRLAFDVPGTLRPSLATLVRKWFDQTPPYLTSAE